MVCNNDETMVEWLLKYSREVDACIDRIYARVDTPLEGLESGLGFPSRKEITLLLAEERGEDVDLADDEERVLDEEFGEDCLQKFFAIDVFAQRDERDEGVVAIWGAQMDP